MSEIWEYQGKPTAEEIQQWYEIDGDMSDHLAIRHQCPWCSSGRTRWIRQEWSVCYSCRGVFTLWEALDYKYFLEEDRLEEQKKLEYLEFQRLIEKFLQETASEEVQ